MKIAESMIGTPYLWGGQNPLEGLDCSGFLQIVLKASGELRTSDLSAQGIFQNLLSTSRTQPPSMGAVAFFGTGLTQVVHVAFCIDEDWCIESIGDSSCVNLEAAKRYRNHNGAYVRRNLIRNRRDYLTSLMPAYLQLQ